MSVTSEEGEFEVELSVFNLVGAVSESILFDGIVVVVVLEFVSWFVGKVELELLAELSVTSEEGEFDVELSVFEVFGSVSGPLIISGGVVGGVSVFGFRFVLADTSEPELLLALSTISGEDNIGLVFSLA